MSISKIATIIPVPDLADAVETWRAILGVSPTFVDGEAWAQFDVAGSRIALAGTDRVGDGVGLMLKVDDLGAAADAARSRGWTCENPVRGAHETRLVARDSSGLDVVFYTPLK